MHCFCLSTYVNFTRGDLHPRGLVSIHGVIFSYDIWTVELCVKLKYLHSLQSAAMPFISSTVISLPFSLSRASSIKTSLRCFLGLPLDCLLCFGFQPSRYLGSRSSGILLTWPNHRSLLEPIICLIGSIEAEFSTSSPGGSSPSCRQ